MLDRQAEIPLYSFSVWVSPVAVFCAGIAMNRDAIAMIEIAMDFPALIFLIIRVFDFFDLIVAQIERHEALVQRCDERNDALAPNLVVAQIERDYVRALFRGGRQRAPFTDLVLAQIERFKKGARHHRRGNRQRCCRQSRGA